MSVRWLSIFSTLCPRNPRATPRRLSLSRRIRCVVKQHTVRADRHVCTAADLQSDVGGTARALRRGLSPPFRTGRHEVPGAGSHHPQLPDGEPRRDEIASELCLSERTLQRRLQDEEETPLPLAAGRHPPDREQQQSRPVAAIAGTGRLFARLRRPKKFFRGCKRWFKVSPCTVPQSIARTRARTRLRGADRKPQ